MMEKKHETTTVRIPHVGTLNGNWQFLLKLQIMKTKVVYRNLLPKKDVTKPFPDDGLHKL